MKSLRYTLIFLCLIIAVGFAGQVESRRDSDYKFGQWRFGQPPFGLDEKEAPCAFEECRREREAITINKVHVHATREAIINAASDDYELRPGPKLKEYWAAVNAELNRIEKGTFNADRGL